MNPVERKTYVRRYGHEPRTVTIDSPTEYALYFLAREHPSLFSEAEQFVGSMLAEDQSAAHRVKRLLNVR